MTGVDCALGAGAVAVAGGPGLARCAAVSGDLPCCGRPVDPFSPDGGLKLLRGNLGRAVIKTSAVADAHRVVEAPARLFNDQEGVLAAFQDGQLNCDVVVVVRFQGPRANGMPELHKLTPALASFRIVASMWRW